MAVDMVLTSPLYDNLRTYAGYSFDFEAIAKALWRVGKPQGVIIWVVADRTINGNETETSFRQAFVFSRNWFLPAQHHDLRQKQPQNNEKGL